MHHLCYRNGSSFPEFSKLISIKKIMPKNIEKNSDKDVGSNSIAVSGIDVVSQLLEKLRFNFYDCFFCPFFWRLVPGLPVLSFTHPRIWVSDWRGIDGELLLLSLSSRTWENDQLLFRFFLLDVVLFRERPSKPCETTFGEGVEMSFWSSSWCRGSGRSRFRGGTFDSNGGSWLAG